MHRKKVNGSALRALRLRKGLLVKELSAKSGVSEGGIIKLESGETSALQDSTLIGLAKGLEMDPMDLEKVLVNDLETHPAKSPTQAPAGEGDSARGEHP